MSDIELVAKVCHEVNRGYCESIGDYSQPRWDKAHKWVRDSAINGVRFFYENPTSTPRDMHNSWMNQKIEDGWVYGEVKDPDKKTHPCIAEYDNLPLQQRIIDNLFIAVCEAMW